MVTQSTAESFRICRSRSTRTAELFSTPWYKSPNESVSNGMSSTIKLSDETVHDVGTIFLDPHMLLSSRRHFREAVLKGESLSRAYAGLGRERE